MNANKNKYMDQGLSHWKRAIQEHAYEILET